jgi:hypothetical protein
LDGITLTKGTSLFTGDFMINPSDPNEIIIQNNTLRDYLLTNPVIRIWALYDNGVTSNAEVKSEAHRVDSLSGAKLYYNSGIDKYVYVMDVAAFDVDSVKITINGLTIQNTTDFTLNPANKKQIYLTNHPIRLGDVIGAYYVVDDTNYIPPLLPADNTFPDIQDMSFLEYLELIQRRLINVRTRKTVSDFNGGYYPTVMNIYDNYLKRSRLDDSDPLQSNGYTFNNLYPFINQYNAFFNRFVNQLLPSTIILRKGGILIRNTSFNRQKFMYRRGVFFEESLQWLVTDSAEYIRPLPDRLCNWTNDYICVSEVTPCDNFAVTNVSSIEDAVTTTSTSTTLPPVIDYNVLIAVGGNANGSEIYKSDNNGITWSKISTTGGYELESVLFINELVGIAAGSEGTVQRTTDGGDTWSLIGNPVGDKIHANATHRFKSVAGFRDDTNFILGGVGDSFFSSFNSGLSWSETPNTGGFNQLATGTQMLSDRTISVSYTGTQRILLGALFEPSWIWQDVDNNIDRQLNTVSFHRGDYQFTA